MFYTQSTCIVFVLILGTSLSLKEKTIVTDSTAGGNDTFTSGMIME